MTDVVYLGWLLAATVGAVVISFGWHVDWWADVDSGAAQHTDHSHLRVGG